MKKYSPPRSGAKSFSKRRHYESGNWIEYRMKFISHNPYCYACGERARVVDHVVAHKGDEKKFWDTHNMIPLCKMCHDIITATFDRHVVPDTEGKMVWIQKKRDEKEVSVRVKVTPIQ